MTLYLNLITSSIHCTCNVLDHILTEPNYQQLQIGLTPFKSNRMKFFSHKTSASDTWMLEPTELTGQRKETRKLYLTQLNYTLWNF